MREQPSRVTSSGRAGSGRAERRRRGQEQDKRRKVLVLGGMVGIALAITIGLILLIRGDDETTGGKAPVVAAASIDPAIVRNGRVLGEPEAPVTLVEWADYQCPYCASFSTGMMPLLIQEYVATGKVRFEYRDLPFIDSASEFGESDMAAEAAACAGDQGKFWEMHDTIFLNHAGENEGAYSKSRLTEMASLIGLEKGAFSACVNDRDHEAEVEAMQAEAVAAGIDSTPTLFLNGVRITYTGVYSDLKADLEAALAG